MYGDLETIQKYWKQLEHERATTDKKAYNRSCFLHAAHLTAATGGVATAVIRDGHDSGGEIKVDLAALTSSKDNRNFDPPLYFKKGLFIDVGDNVTSVIVHFCPEKEKQ